MTPERWRQAKALLEAALARDPDGRAAWLADACKEDALLREEVESLIASYEEDRDFMEAPAVASAPSLGGAAPAPEGRMVGPYRLIREIGHGGMGTVFMAARADDQYRKRVAIKLVRRGMDSEQILARFRNERQILASLDHPNIARLLDGGTTDDGLPYFVMEYIEGQPIDRFCDEQRLSTTERLRLFRTACSAVHFAHQNLVVHRDLKPSNILVTPDGVPKLLDFGIAKLLKPELYAQTLTPTVTTLRPMTPDYASPEQVKGLPITTASDVYSLGVLLYELLSGHRPYQLKSYTPVEIEKVICGQEPERPSAAIGRTVTTQSADGMTGTLTPEIVSRPREGQPERLRRKLKGDLDNIILMAMRKEPGRRYTSVEQFSEDLRRHLEGLPVIARKDTFAYRAGKFVTRNKVAVGVALAFVLLVAVSLVVIVRQSVRAARERDKAQQVSQFLTEIFKFSDPNEARGRAVTAREILDKGAERIERELQGQPEVQATLMDTIGLVYGSLGLYDSALPLLEKSLQIRRDLFGEENLEVAKSLNDLGWMLAEKRNITEAEPRLREALALRRKLLGNEHVDTAESLNLLALALYEKGDLPPVEALQREALAIRRKRLGEHMSVAQSLNNLGLTLQSEGDYQAAEPLYREAIAMAHKLFGDTAPGLGTYLNNLGLLKLNQGDYAAAEPLFREALAMDRKLLGSEHPSIAVALNNLAETLREQSNYAAAEPLYREAIAIDRKLIGEESSIVAIFTNNLARLLYEKGDSAASGQLARQALATLRKTLGDEHQRTARCLTLLAQMSQEKGDAATAEQLLRQSLEVLRKSYPQGHPNIAPTLIELGVLLTERGAPQEAEGLLREALALRRKVFAEDNWNIGEAESALGGCLVALHRFEEAEPLLVEGYTTLKAKRGDADKQTVRARARLLRLYSLSGKPDKAAAYRAASN
ncbi:MAG TPA: serine/threonine-protein kinase [Blastocatellia bacterium]|nr:serine/threonine-protein kinase [Blastocatellia bacterium]